MSGGVIFIFYHMWFKMKKIEKIQRQFLNGFLHLKNRCVRLNISYRSELRSQAASF